MPIAGQDNRNNITTNPTPCELFDLLGQSEIAATSSMTNAARTY